MTGKLKINQSNNGVDHDVRKRLSASKCAFGNMILRRSFAKDDQDVALTDYCGISAIAPKILPASMGATLPTTLPTTLPSTLPTSVPANLTTLTSKRSLPYFSRLQLAYRIVRPALLDSPKAPILVVHGGPSLASEYLYSLGEEEAADGPETAKSPLRDRAIIFYDQLGCGWSSVPQQDDLYSTSLMSEDLAQLIDELQQKWRLKSFHLLGHSFGGAVGYEYLKQKLHSCEQQSPREDCTSCKCLSLTISNAASSFQCGELERARLFANFQQTSEDHHNNASENQSSNKKCEQHLIDTTDETVDASEVNVTNNLGPNPRDPINVSAHIQKKFHQTHICRTSRIPSSLQSAFRRVSKHWYPSNYIASPPASKDNKRPRDSFPPVQIVIGEYDFVTPTCILGWRDIFSHQDPNHEKEGIKNMEESINEMNVEAKKPSSHVCLQYHEVVMKDCSHYCHLEKPFQYAKVIQNFCEEVETSTMHY